MSVSAATAAQKIPRRTRTSPSDPTRVRILEWAVIVPALGLLIARTIAEWPLLRQDLLDLLVWTGVVVAVDLIPILYSTEVHLTMSLPILLAAGMIFAPAEAALVAFAGTVDLRHWRREIGLERALFNRCQVALSCLVASSLFHALGGDVYVWPTVLVVSLIAMAADGVINIVLVTSAAVLYTRRPVWHVFSRVLLGAPVAFALSYLSLAPIGTLVALAATEFGVWGLLASVVPVVMARQAFALRKRSALASAQSESRKRLLVKLEERIADERRDERAKIAMNLHDEVLASLYQVHLMSEVLHQDLASGKLLALEEDLPALRQAANDATNSIRVFIRSLRASSLGPSGLVSTLRLLIDELSSSSQVKFEARLELTRGTPWVHLLIYQIAREALRNAVRHSGAREVAIQLFDDNGDARLVVRDDGSGFDLEAVDLRNHFGLQMMRERAGLAGGLLHIQSEPGGGTVVAARIPLGNPATS